jgi:hypothetical protein
MYYSAPESPLQGESRNELETLNLDELETLNYSFVTSDSTNGDNLENNGEGTDEANGHILNDGNSLDQMEEVQPPPVPASPCQSVPLNQLLSQSDSIPESQVHSESSSSIPESQVNSEPHIKMLPNRVTRGKPRVNYEPVLDSKPKYPMSNFVSYHKLSKECESFVNQLSAVSIPNSVQEALRDPRWKEAMNEEMKSLQKNSTWEVGDLPEGKKPVGCRWVFTIKYKADGMIERYKARLVAKGYTQT